MWNENIKFSVDTTRSDKYTIYILIMPSKSESSPTNNFGNSLFLSDKGNSTHNNKAIPARIPTLAHKLLVLDMKNYERWKWEKNPTLKKKETNGRGLHSEMIRVVKTMYIDLKFPVE